MLSNSCPTCPFVFSASALNHLKAWKALKKMKKVTVVLVISCQHSDLPILLQISLAVHAPFCENTAHTALTLSICSGLEPATSGMKSSFQHMVKEAKKKTNSICLGAIRVQHFFKKGLQQCFLATNICMDYVV